MARVVTLAPLGERVSRRAGTGEGVKAADLQNRSALPRAHGQDSTDRGYQPEDL